MSERGGRGRTPTLRSGGLRPSRGVAAMPGLGVARGPAALAPASGSVLAWGLGRVRLQGCGRLAGRVQATRPRRACSSVHVRGSGAEGLLFGPGGPDPESGCPGGPQSRGLQGSPAEHRPRGLWGSPGACGPACAPPDGAPHGGAGLRLQGGHHRQGRRPLLNPGPRALGAWAAAAFMGTVPAWAWAAPGSAALQGDVGV